MIYYPFFPSFGFSFILLVYRGSGVSFLLPSKRKRLRFRAFSYSTFTSLPSCSFHSMFGFNFLFFLSGFLHPSPQLIFSLSSFIRSSLLFLFFSSSLLFSFSFSSLFPTNRLLFFSIFFNPKSLHVVNQISKVYSTKKISQSSKFQVQIFIKFSYLFLLLLF